MREATQGDYPRQNRTIAASSETSEHFSTLIAGGNHVQCLYREENQAYVKKGSSSKSSKSNSGSADSEDELIPYDTQGVWLRIKVRSRTIYFYSYHYLLPSFEFEI